MRQARVRLEGVSVSLEPRARALGALYCIAALAEAETA